MWSAASKYLFDFLNFLYSFIGSWGWAIIVLTLLVRIVLHPLNAKQMVSMQKMQKLQPRLKVLQEKYANDKETLSRETMALYKENNVNPAAGCLPLLIQLPILILLFQVLRETSFGGASFAGITLEGSVLTTMADALGMTYASVAEVGFTDVFKAIGANPAGLLKVGTYLPNLLLLLAIAFLTWFQQKLSSSGNPQMAGMNIFMPIFMAFICLSMPGGVMLYWGFSSFLACAQQWWTVRKVNNEEKPVLLKEKPRAGKDEGEPEKATFTPRPERPQPPKPKYDDDDFIPH
ncbi:MAG: YidC/Oxa1 family membrane protein insertase [Pyramidobacter sp.]|nr:YidC/Oxa1 family membrane protein insertase [Pyramidobacter sp.]